MWVLSLTSVCVCVCKKYSCTLFLIYTHAMAYMWRPENFAEMGTLFVLWIQGPNTSLGPDGSEHPEG